jgi:integrase
MARTPSRFLRICRYWHNFSNRAWRKVLESLPGIEYRNPYQTRHTFITLALKTQKVDLKDLANFCGNSPKIILERYAGITRNFVMPEI